MARKSLQATTIVLARSNGNNELFALIRILYCFRQGKASQINTAFKWIYKCLSLSLYHATLHTHTHTRRDTHTRVCVCVCVYNTHKCSHIRAPTHAHVHLEKVLLTETSPAIWADTIY